MKINDNFKFDDTVSGLRLSVVQGKNLDRLHIEIDPGSPVVPVVRNRDFFFTRDGDFDGTGSGVESCPEKIVGPPELVRDGGRSLLDSLVGKDPWKHRSKGMLCATCMYYVEKATGGTFTHAEIARTSKIGRCRRHAPTMSGYPVVFPHDWCGDHKLDENRA